VCHRARGTPLSWRRVRGRSMSARFDSTDRPRRPPPAAALRGRTVGTPTPPAGSPAVGVMACLRPADGREDGTRPSALSGRLRHERGPIQPATCRQITSRRRRGTSGARGRPLATRAIAPCRPRRDRAAADPHGGSSPAALRRALPSRIVVAGRHAQASGTVDTEPSTMPVQGRAGGRFSGSGDVYIPRTRRLPAGG
jgi:hypothetical protein